MQKDTYKEAEIFRFPGMVAKVYTPILESKERENRMKEIHRATAHVLKSKLHNGEGERQWTMN